MYIIIICQCYRYTYIYINTKVRHSILSTSFREAIDQTRDLNRGGTWRYQRSKKFTTCFFGSFESIKSSKEGKKKEGRKWSESKESNYKKRILGTMRTKRVCIPRDGQYYSVRMRPLTRRTTSECRRGSFAFWRRHKGRRLLRER